MSAPLKLSLALNAAAILAAGWVVAHRLNRPEPIPYAQVKADIYASLPINRSDIVFLGDSILDNGEWSELVPHAKNRAIGGSTTKDIMDRVDDIGTPAVVVLCMGINDLMRGYPVKEIQARYWKTVRMLQAKDCRVLCVPVLPVDAALYRAVVAPAFPRSVEPQEADVNALNDYIRSLGVEMIDAPPLSGNSLDGLHLNGWGLGKLAEAINRKLL